ncbi:hypothetical protein TNIN_120391 [Trichonephila inaurata madagascariensis]|uniref:Uncharacterized protein n=1 Tax=Trichonephila inaurata madagascariensis TaxID=2747483 RepID=A0A8X6XXZ9_9ARAC|nr:hypothetical protein TNIN_120391 [Trichonephila inaurata madagascariensis]
MRNEKILHAKIFKLPAQGEGGSEITKTSTKSSPFGRSIKSWRGKFLKYSPTCKNSKPKYKSNVAPKDEQSNIKELSFTQLYDNISEVRRKG